MELQILWLIKISSCCQFFHLLSPLVIHGVEKQSPSSLLSLAHSSSFRSFMLTERLENERDVKKRGNVPEMTGQCQNNSPAVIFVQRSFNMVTEMHIQYSLDLRSFSDGFHVWAGDWLAYNCLGHKSSNADKDKKDIQQRCEMRENAKTHIELTSCASKQCCPLVCIIWQGN